MCASVIDIETPLGQSAKELVESTRRIFKTGRTKCLEFRRGQLKKLLRMYEETKEEFIEALHEDLRKPKQESFMAELKMITNDLKNLIYNFDRYTKPRYLTKSLDYLFDTPMVIKEPYGVVLIIGAWNYPMQVTLLPLAGAIAAGNCVILKPSELSSNSSRYMARNIQKYLDGDCYKVFSGGISETTELLREKFDYIFFTGSTQVGKIIQKAAAENLTPTTLELGGKCPVIIDDDVDIEITTRRILWGKFLNLGQTCVGPDYVLCTKEIQQKFLIHSKIVIQEFYGNNPQLSKDLSRVITKKHFNRLVNLIRTCKVEIGGTFDSDDLYIAPTILTDVKMTDRVMQEEIFGPILPLINVSGVKEAVDLVNEKEKPLSLYVFSKNRKTVDYVIERTSSGSVTVNDTVIQVLCGNLPFGGVGNSGMGSYHGRKTFDTFTHEKSVLKKSFLNVAEKLQRLRYPPYSENKIRLIDCITEKRNWGVCKVSGYIVVFILGFAFGCFLEYILF